jgi:hypothetical protein
MRALQQTALTVVLISQLPCLVGLAKTPGRKLQGSGSQYCSSTAASLLRPCGFATDDNYWTTTAKCTNVSDAQERAQCIADAQDSRSEGSQECEAQYATGLAACGLLGEDRCDPEINPSAFERNYADVRNPNRSFPLAIGNRWVYRSGHERDTVEVLDQTKRIAGVTCIVVRDLVSVDGQPHEATDDWYAQADDGNVWYFSEKRSKTTKRSLVIGQERRSSSPSTARSRPAASWTSRALSS